jgi:hypothetical protein
LHVDQLCGANGQPLEMSGFSLSQAGGSLPCESSPAENAILGRNSGAILSKIRAGAGGRSPGKMPQDQP